MSLMYILSCTLGPGQSAEAYGGRGEPFDFLAVALFAKGESLCLKMGQFEINPTVAKREKHSI